MTAVPKNWGTTGYVVNNKHNKGARMTSWKDFWDRTKTDYSGRTMVHDYQLTTIGNALKYFGYSFNSVDPAELADAEKLLLEVKPKTADGEMFSRKGEFSIWVDPDDDGALHKLDFDLSFGNLVAKRR